MANSNNEKVKLYIVVALLVMAAAVAYFRFFYTPKSAPPKPSAVAAAPKAAFNIPTVKPRAVPEKPPEKQPVATATDMRIRDIFAPPAEPVVVEKPVPETEPQAKTVVMPPAPKPPPVLHLTGILTSGRNPIAIIDNQFLRIGDTIADFRVAEIGQNEVRLVSGDRQMVLKVHE